jgi:hypothetical protein
MILAFAQFGLVILLLRPQEGNVWLLAWFFAGLPADPDALTNRRRRDGFTGEGLEREGRGPTGVQSPGGADELDLQTGGD